MFRQPTIVLGVFLCKGPERQLDKAKVPDLDRSKDQKHFQTKKKKRLLPLQSHQFCHFSETCHFLNYEMFFLSSLAIQQLEIGFRVFFRMFVAFHMHSADPVEPRPSQFRLRAATKVD